MSSPPNILLIITDQQSADAMSCAIGNEWLNTPAMDSLAANGVRFDRAYCSHPLCVPSRTAMFTGHYPHETGVLSNNDERRDISSVPCVGALLRDAGYDTGYIGKWHLPYPIDNTQLHGFSYCADNRCNEADLYLNDLAIRFIQTQRDAPFFLVASYNNPHNICEWARGARGELPDGSIGVPPGTGELPPLKPNHLPQENEPDAVTLLRRSYHASPTFPVGNFSERDWREYRWAYYRMVEWIDRRVAALRDAINTNGLRETTAVIFVSDHGDSQGAHRWNQKTVLLDESTRVPCIVSYPQRVAAGVSNALVQTGIDLVPTLCDLANLNPPTGMHGRSMLDLLSGTAERPYIVAQTRFVQGAHIDGEKPVVDGRMVRSRRYKYCVYDCGTRRESLVDMETDPGETINVADNSDYASVLHQHRRWLREFCAETSDPFPVARPVP